jgi:hypothetical protein
MIEREPTREDLLERITKLEEALRSVERWSFDTATDLTAAGYEDWSTLIPWTPGAAAEPSLPASDPAHYELAPDVNTCLRGAIMASAAVIDALAVSFHPRRGNPGLRSDLERARRMLKSAYGDVQRALAVLNRGEVRTRH